MDEKWAVFGSEDTTAIWVEDESGERVCTLRNCETDLERARLIADAPQTAAERARLKAINAELVKALDGMLGVFAKPHNETLLEVIAARAALSKTKGS